MGIGNLKIIFETLYREHCIEAFEELCESCWPCAFQKGQSKKNRCVNVALGHSKGHQNADGKIISAGDYVASFVRADASSIWLFKISAQMELFDDLKNKASGERDDGMIPYEVHDSTIQAFYTPNRSTRYLQSNTVCLYCLMGAAVHVLPCGHVLCDACVRLRGRIQESGNIKLKSCLLCTTIKKLIWTDFEFPLKPSSAGVRILSLDG